VISDESAIQSDYVDGRSLKTSITIRPDGSETSPPGAV